MSDALQAWSFLVEEVNGRVTFGRPGVRDPDALCVAFDPVPGIDWLGMYRTAPGTGDGTRCAAECPGMHEARAGDEWQCRQYDPPHSHEHPMYVGTEPPARRPACIAAEQAVASEVA